MRNVSISKQEKIRHCFYRLLNSLLHRPELAGPAGRKIASLNDSEILRFPFGDCGSARCVGCAVRAGVIDQKNMDSLNALLLQERTDRTTDNISLISGRNDHRNPD